MCENYLQLTHKEDIHTILDHSEKDKYFSININFLELFESDPNLGNALLTDPESSINCWNEAAFNVQNDLIKDLAEGTYILKNNVNCRVYNLPPWPHVSRIIFPGNEDAGQFLQITGTIVRMSARKLLEYQRKYICVNCKYPITVKAKYDKRNIIKAPKSCSNPEGCNSKNMITFGELDIYNCKDYQEIKIQEDLSKLGVGTVPAHMMVTLEDDLVNTCKPGENVTITGIVTRRWTDFDKGFPIVIDIVLRANHIQVNNSSGLSLTVSDDMQQFFNSFWERYSDEPLVGRNVILRSIAPEIYGVHMLKLAMAIVLAGGSVSEDNNLAIGVDRRCESHLLFVGDPGTGKSQMLKFAAKIIPRSVLTTGVGTTAAGLTVTALMENGEWQLEAGALVMADGGICCIDEFNSMREHDRTSIHEAMEQQTISVAKAGIVCKLKTRCSILAACNPKGNIDLTKPLCINVAMSSPLLSRFDLVLLIRDVVNEENDRKLCEHLLNKSCTLSGESNVWNLEKLQAYYAIIRKQNPKLTNEAETILSTYYQFQRKFGSRNKSRTTVRLLESLVRLSQGHAKLMFHPEVQILDAIFAVILTDTSMDAYSALLNLKIDNNSFLEDPEPLYWEALECVVEKLNLDYIYERELQRIGTENKCSSETNHGLLNQNNKRPGLFTQKLRQNNLEESGDSGNFSKTSDFITQDSVKGISKCHQISNINKPSTSKDTCWSKKVVETSPASQDGAKAVKKFENVKRDLKNERVMKETSVLDRKKLKKVCEKGLSLSEIVKSRSQMDFDLDFEFPVEIKNYRLDHSRAKSCDKSQKRSPNTTAEAAKESKGLAKCNLDLLKEIPSVNDDFNQIGVAIDWNLEETTDAEKISEKSDYVHRDFNNERVMEKTGALDRKKLKKACEKGLSLCEIVKRRSQIDFDLDLEFPVEIKKYRLDHSRAKSCDKSQKRSPNTTAEAAKASKGLAKCNLDLLKEIPSVNDDFNQIGVAFDWNLEETTSAEKISGKSDYVDRDFNNERVMEETGALDKKKLEKVCEKGLSLSEIVKRRSQIDFDLDLEFPVEIKDYRLDHSSAKSCDKSQKRSPNTTAEAAKASKGLAKCNLDLLKEIPSVNDDFNQIGVAFDWNLEETTNAEKISGKSDYVDRDFNNERVMEETGALDKKKLDKVCEKGLSLSEIVKRRSQIDFDLDLEFPVEIKNYRLDHSSAKSCDKSQKRSPNTTAEAAKASKGLSNHNLDLLKEIPSVNDDFNQIGVAIDWNLEETTNAEKISGKSDYVDRDFNNERVMEETGALDKKKLEKVCEKGLSLSEIVKRRSQIDFDLDLGFPVEIKKYRLDHSRAKSCEKKPEKKP